MKTFFLIIFLFISCSLFSQSINKIIREVGKDYNSKNYEKALSGALLADSIYKNSYDIENTEYSEFLSRIGAIYFTMEKYNEASTYYLKSIENFRSYSVIEKNPVYISVLNDYVRVLIIIERYAEAEPLLTEALQLQKEISGDQSGEYANCLSTLGELQLNSGNYGDAEINFLKAISIWKKKEGKYSNDYANTLYSLADLYYERDQYKLSLPLYNEVTKRFKKIWGEKDQQYAGSLADLGEVYDDLSDYNSALTLFKQALEIYRVAGGEQSKDYAGCILKLANLHRDMGNYDQAEILYKQALTIQNNGGYDNEETLFNLSGFYQIMGNFSAAEKLILEVLAKDEKLGKESSDYLAAQNLLANLYTLMGSYDKALVLYKSIIEKSKNAPGKSSAAYATYLDNLANLYENMEEYELAQPVALKALEIKREIFGEFSSDVAYSLHNLTVVYKYLKDFTNAENFCKREIEIYRKILGEGHNDYASSLNELAAIYRIEGKYAEAEQLYNQSINIVEKQFGDKHPMYANSLLSLSELYVLTGKSDAAEPLYLKVNLNLNNQIRQNFTFMAEKEKEQFISTLSTDFEDINSFVFTRKDLNPSITTLAYNNILELKGIVLQSSRALRQAALNSNDKELIKLYDSFYQNKQLLSKLDLQPPEERWMNTDSLETICSEQEKTLNKRIQLLPGLNDFNGIGNQIKWQDIENALGKDEAAIEFISFHPLIKMKDSDTSILYCALILRPGMSNPGMTYLFKENDLISLLNEAKSRTDELTVDKLYKMPSAVRTGSSEKTTNKLYKLVWEPIENLLTGAKTIYYSPTGLLNKLSFDAIPVNDSTYLSDRYNLHAVLSTRVILKKEDDKLQINSILNPVVYGGINYDSDTTTMKSVATRYVMSDSGSRGHFDPGDLNRGGGFTYLDGTLREIEKIQKLLTDNNVNPTTITGNDATEESFKSLNNLKSPVFIHIATHGFFFPEPMKARTNQPFIQKSTFDPFKNSENPLLRSGLIFAGANHAWKNQPLPANVEDGILLASEVSEMYLPNTKLVVLSACETGLGDIKGSEGVFGLQRAFKMAGVKYLINSLWQVPDYQTSELMSKFYEYWLSGLPIRDSFRNAQTFLKHKYSDNPFNWAAFVLLE